jgi:hypothetical protein
MICSKDSVELQQHMTCDFTSFPAYEISCLRMQATFFLINSLFNSTNEVMIPCLFFTDQIICDVLVMVINTKLH